jgi:VWFA-related protein
VRRFSIVLFLVSILFGDRAVAQKPEAVFRSSVALVPISAIVRDHRGRAITTLRPSDFEVRDNGEPRPIVSFQSDADLPLTIALLVDMSGSMRLESKSASAREVISAIAGELHDGVDMAGVFTFDTAVHEVCGFTDRPALLESALANATPFGATSLYDAIAETARRLGDLPAGRRAIVVLTDGVDTSSVLAAADVSARASEIDVPVYIVATVPRIDMASYLERAAGPIARSTADAQDLARWTGGELLWANGTIDAARAARQILSELRYQYLLSVDSAIDGGWRAVEVRVKGRRFTVRTRSGYFVRDTHSGSDR